MTFDVNTIRFFKKIPTRCHVFCTIYRHVFNFSIYWACL